MTENIETADTTTETSTPTKKQILMALAPVAIATTVVGVAAFVLVKKLRSTNEIAGE